MVAPPTNTAAPPLRLFDVWCTYTLHVRLRLRMVAPAKYGCAPGNMLVMVVYGAHKPYMYGCIYIWLRWLNMVALLVIC
jgi:hypothetical protein